MKRFLLFNQDTAKVTRPHSSPPLFPDHSSTTSSEHPRNLSYLVECHILVGITGLPPPVGRIK